jgi:hypothetical protein
MAGTAFAACSKGQAELQMPTIELSQYLKGTTSDFDDATLNAMAEPGGQAGYEYGIMKAIYPTLFNANKDAVAAAVFGSPYKFGDGVSPTTYAQLTAADQMTVDGTIFATKLSAAEQDTVTNAVIGFFNRQNADTSAAISMEQNMAYGILAGSVSADAANEWKTDATAWMAALNAKAAADYSGTTYAQLTLAQKAAVTAAMTIIDPETAFYQAMVKDSFRNGTASSMNPTLADSITAAQYPGKTYATLNPMLERPVVDAMVWAQLDATGQAAVDAAVAGLFALAMSQPADASNVLYTTLSANVGPTAAVGWLADVTAGKNMEWMFYKWMVFESFRNGTAASFYPTQVANNVTAAQAAGLIAATTYAACNAYEKAIVNGMVWAGLGAGEQGYVLGAALPGLFGLVQAEMTDAVSLNQTICYLILQSNVDATSAEGWEKDVTAGVDPSQAFYRWLAKEGVLAMAAADPLIQLGVEEFDFKVTNPNDYDISLDSLDMDFHVTASTGDNVDAAKQAMTNSIWVPAKEGDNEGQIILQVFVPAKTYNMITWLVSSGTTSDKATALAEDVWGQIQAGTATWYVTVKATISSKTETETQTYTLQWPLS